MGMEGWSWQRGEREVQGSLYWEEFSARAAICTSRWYYVIFLLT
jgi:hypothetical protein